MAAPLFRFKQFQIEQEGVTQPAGTDGVLLGAWTNTEGAREILDIGTGTGLVALMLAQRSGPETRVTAVEIHPESADCAGRNFRNSPWANRLSVVAQAVQDFSRSADRRFDLIVSNPPFFSEALASPDEKRRLARSTQTLRAVDLLDAVLGLLAPGGRFCLILPLVEGRRFAELACLSGLYCTRETQVYPRANKPIERLLLQFERNPYPFRRSKMDIYAYGEQWSEGFRALTRAFYLHF